MVRGIMGRSLWVSHLRTTLRPRTLWTVLLQGFASGLPLALVGSTLQAWYAVSGVDIVVIGALSLVGQPYVYKFLWAPFLDRFVPPFLGRRRGWIICAQMGLTASLAVMAVLNPRGTPWLLCMVALVTAFLSASQDIAIDAYRTDLLGPEERGPGAALYTLGYRTAMLASGGVALVMADHVGWRATYLVMALVVALGMAVTWRSPALNESDAPSSLRRAVVEPLREFLARDAALGVLLFIVLYKLTDAFALALGSKFLLDIGYSLTQIGVVYKGVGLVATLMGALLGGVVMVRWPIYRALMVFGALQGASNLVFLWLALTTKSSMALGVAVFVENICGGLGTIALLSFLMQLCDRRYTATQFALLSALSALGRVYVGPFAGLAARALGVEVHPAHWAIFYFWSFVAAFPALFLLYALRGRQVFCPCPLTPVASL